MFVCIAIDSDFRAKSSKSEHVIRQQWIGQPR
jgi:hypothetical protein